MPILYISRIFPDVANDEETKFFFYIIFLKCYLILKNVSVIFASKLTNFTDFYELLKKLYDCSFILNLVEKNNVKLP